MSRRALAALALLVVLAPPTARAATGALGPRAAASGPAATSARARVAGDNVLLVIADDLGVEAIRAYGVGNGAANTPTLDALMADGVRFDAAWAYPLCTPFRASVLTGRFGFRTGVGTVLGGAGTELPYDELIIPEVLTAHPELGVTHAAIGKWHLSPFRGPSGGADAPNRHGFGHYAGSLGVVADYFTWEKVVDGRTETANGYATTIQADDAAAWIAAQPGPWFAYLAFNAPHSPFHRPPDALHTRVLPPGDPAPGQSTPYFLAAIEALDTELGRLLDGLDPATRARTHVIFVGDNGSPAQAEQAPFDRARSKGTLYQGGLWVPLIISGPAVAAPGRASSALVSSVDLFATVLELLGVAPGDWASATDSVSLVPYLTRPDQPAIRDWAFSEQFGDANDPSVDGKAIRDARYKLIRFDDGREELYDLRDDPYEAVDLLQGSPSAAASAARTALSEQLDRLLAGPPTTPGPSPTPTSTATIVRPNRSPTATPEPPNGTPTATPEPSAATPTAALTAEPTAASPTTTPEPPEGTPSATPEPPGGTSTITAEPPAGTTTPTLAPPSATPGPSMLPPTAESTPTAAPPVAGGGRLYLPWSYTSP